MLRLAAALIVTMMFSSGTYAETVYHRGNTHEPGSLDPHKAATINEGHILTDLFEGLVAYDAGANIIPGVADSWTVSNDRTVYTFKLRPDAGWSNGDPVVADDFVFAFRRLLDPATASEYASVLYVIRNASKANAGEAKLEDIGVKAVAPATLEITLEAPTPYFLELLAHMAAKPVHRATIEKFGADWTKPNNMVSNGAFTLAEWVPNDHIRLVKNPKFRDADSVRLNAVVYYPTDDRSTAMKRFEAGELDSNDDIPTEQLAELKAKFGTQVHVGPILGTFYCAIKLDKEPWNNVELRRAISMAIDRDFLAEKVWQNSMFPAYGMVPPGIGGYSAFEPAYAGMPAPDREAEAKRIVRELGFGPEKPLPLQFRFFSSENNTNTGIAIQEQLRPLGIAVSLYNSDVNAHFAHLENKGDFDLGVSGWIADYRDPETFLSLVRRGNTNNFGDYDNAKFERLMDEAAAAGGEPERRMELLAEAEQTLIDDVALIPLLFYSYRDVVSSKLSGWVGNAMNVHPSRFIAKSQ